MERNDLEQVILYQQSNFLRKEEGVRRDVNFTVHQETDQVSVIMGPRRCGKSTLLRQFASHYSTIKYLNFDDERLLDFTVKDFEMMMEIFLKDGDVEALFFDEIQNIPSWERFIRRIHDEGYKVYVTGSNASMLSSELATHLTGRHKNLILYPFSFLEYCTFLSLNGQPRSTQETGAIIHAFDRYLTQGGYPEYIQTGDYERLQAIYEDTLYKDIAVRFKISDTRVLRDFGRLLFSSFSKEISFTSMAKTLGVQALQTVKSYTKYFEDTYLAFELLRFDHSFKKQIIGQRKIYAVDHGLCRYIYHKINEDTGRILENIVAIELKRRGKEIYLHREKRECDFLVREGNMDPVLAIQVTWSLADGNREREHAGFEEVLLRYPGIEMLYLTYDQEGEVMIGNRKVQMLPVWKWLVKKPSSVL